MSKLALTLIASVFAVSAFAADAIKLPAASASAPVVASSAKKVTKVKHHKSHKAVKHAAKAATKVAPTK